MGGMVRQYEPMISSNYLLRQLVTGVACVGGITTICANLILSELSRSDR